MLVALRCLLSSFDGAGREDVRYGCSIYRRGRGFTPPPPIANGARIQCSTPGRVLQLNARYANVMDLYLITAHGLLQHFQ